jgi:hypothetical protein
MSTIPLSDVSAFLGIAEKGDLFNANTIQSRRIAFNKFLEILDDDQRTLEYLRDNLDVVKARFTNRHAEMRGASVDAYANRVQSVLKDFLAWRADRSAFERDVAARQSSRASAADGEKRARSEKPRPAPAASAARPEDDADTQTITIPLPAGTRVVVKLPRELLVKDLKRVLWALLPYASDWDPSESPRQTFPQLEGRPDLSA